jgi:putative membrane protein
MKKGRITPKSFTYLAFLSMSLVVVTACNDNKPEDPKEVAEDQNEERFDDRKSEKDAAFLVEAAAINLKEIKLGELAVQKGTLGEVKDLGKMMIKEHTTALNDLKKLAASMSVTLPTSLTEDGQGAYDKLTEKSIQNFDKEYSEMMVKGHEDAINQFEWASSNAEDLAIRNGASSMLPALHSHLEHANAVHEKAKAVN